MNKLIRQTANTANRQPLAATHQICYAQLVKQFLAAGNQLDLGTLQLKQNSGFTTTLGGNFPVDPTTGLRYYVSWILPNALIFASLILLGLIILGGIGLIFTAGNPEAQQKNKDVVSNAALGFALVFGAYWIIQIIQILTGVDILK